MNIGDISWSRLFRTAGGNMKTVSLTITENGTYTAPNGVRYTPIIVNVGGGSLVGTAIVGKDVVGSEDISDVVGTAIVGRSIVRSEDTADVVGVAIVGKSTTN